MRGDGARPEVAGRWPARARPRRGASGPRRGGLITSGLRRVLAWSRHGGPQRDWLAASVARAWVRGDGSRWAAGAVAPRRASTRLVGRLGGAGVGCVVTEAAGLAAWSRHGGPQRDWLAASVARPGTTWSRCPPWRASPRLVGLAARSRHGGPQRDWLAASVAWAWVRGDGSRWAGGVVAPRRASTRLVGRLGGAGVGAW